jgi:exonuclease SbcC
MFDEALASREEAGRVWAQALHRLETLDLGRPLPSPLTADGLAELERHIRASATRLEALLPRERELHEARTAVAEADTQLAEATAAHAKARERLEAVPAALEQARAKVQAVAAVAGRAAALTLQLDQARQRLMAAHEAEQCEVSLDGLRDAERDARDRAADARERVQDLTARRLAGIAAELAGQLAEGEACQVCGSTEHPAPAETSSAAVTETEQAEAAAAYDARSADYAAASGKVLQAEQRLQGLREAAGQLSCDEAASEVERHEADLAEARQAQAELERAEVTVTRLAAEQQQLTAAVHELDTRVATLTQTTYTLRLTIETLAAEIAGAVGNDAKLSDEVLRLSSVASSLGEAREALCDHDACVVRAEELEAHALSSAREHEFDDLVALRAAVLQPSERARLELLLESRAQAAARAHAVLEGDDVRSLESQDTPDVAALAAELTAAEQQEAAVARIRHQREDVTEALARQRLRLEQAVTAWGPVREEYLRADSMSKLVRGMSADNQLQMRLSAYVLATRLDQVVAAANERLAHMRDQRYLLQRTGRAARKGAQAGLGLEVIDQWAGDVRDPSTLSGGETFVVSLALALGLADVVTQEAGGTEIETLFVDEGFGTLDPDTLDDVMDRLDDLRTGGRAVGVVSHVSELRNRIPTQLHVEKRRNGSAVSVRTAVG